MTAFFNTNFEVLVDAIDLAGFATQADLSIEFDSIDVTTLASNGWRNLIPGMGQSTFNVTGFQSLTSVEPFFQGTGTGSNIISIAPQNGGMTIGDPVYFGGARTVTRTPLSGAVGDAAGFTLNWTSDGRLARGQVIHPLAARTATGTGTVTTFTTPVAGQHLVASFHVTAVSGTGSITFTVATDDAVGFGTPTTRITSAAMTGTGGQLASAAGPFAGETHARVGWTITGFTSVTFFVALGVSPTPA